MLCATGGNLWEKNFFYVSIYVTFIGFFCWNLVIFLDGNIVQLMGF